MLIVKTSHTRLRLYLLSEHFSKGVRESFGMREAYLGDPVI